MQTRQDPNRRCSFQHKANAVPLLKNGGGGWENILAQFKNPSYGQQWVSGVSEATQTGQWGWGGEFGGGSETGPLAPGLRLIGQFRYLTVGWAPSHCSAQGESFPDATAQNAGSPRHLHPLSFIGGTRTSDTWWLHFPDPLVSVLRCSLTWDTLEVLLHKTSKPNLILFLKISSKDWPIRCSDLNLLQWLQLNTNLHQMVQKWCPLFPFGQCASHLGSCLGS